MSLSELINNLSVSNTPNDIKKLEELFLRTHVGLIISGLPALSHGSRYVAGKNELSFKCVADPNGKNMVKACADPKIFSKKYNEKITATMTGQEIIEMILKLNEVDGILLCSAISFNSFPVYKERGRGMIEVSKRRVKNEWWKFWN